MQNEYAPESVSPPGGTLQDLLNEHQMAQAELAARTGRPPRLINEIIRGKASITPATALQFEKVFGVPAHFWLNRERDYQEYLERRKDQERIETQVRWLDCLPVRELRRRGHISGTRDKREQVLECLRFFGVASPEAWRDVYETPQASFRRSRAFTSDPGAVAAWLRAGELISDQQVGTPCSRERLRSLIPKIRCFTMLDAVDLQRKLGEVCADVGVVIAFVPEVPGARVSGATRWLSPQRALIQLSLRYKTDDHLWFTFFHEMGHILLHGKKDVFLEYDGGSSPEEQEADRFSAEALIPPEDYRRLLKKGREVKGHWSKNLVKRFADEIGIAPGIVVGRLQHDGHLPRTHLNDLKRRFEWSTSRK